MGGTRHDATTSHAGVSDLAWQHLWSTRNRLASFGLQQSLRPPVERQTKMFFSSFQKVCFGGI
jgi:hypothetical protein